MSRFLEEREVSDVLDLLRPPAGRDLPHGQLETRKQLLLSAIAPPQAVAAAGHPLRSRFRRIAGWLGCLLAVGIVGVGASRTEIRPLHVGQVAEAVAAVGAGATIAAQAAVVRGGGQQLVRTVPALTAVVVC
jgi:hypothetical protein